MLSLVDSFLLVPGMELRYWIPFLGITIILRLSDFHLISPTVSFPGAIF